MAGGGAGGRREGPRQLRLFAAAAFAGLLLPLTSCGGDPPQIVDYSPQRGSIDVSTTVPIRIAFDHNVDQGSVQSRLHILPAVTGAVQWLSARELVFDHATLSPSTTYEVILDSGYRDAAGNVYALRHHWSFVTERAPSLTGSTPARADQDVDPASPVTLDFTRQMDPTTLRSGISFEPAVPFNVRLDPADPRRAILFPTELLTPDTAYRITLSVAGLDVDGNQLDRDQSIDFTTGAARALHGWITFTTAETGGAPAGLWMVNESGVPRQLFGTDSVRSFTWAPGGNTLLAQGDQESWWELTPGVGSVMLDFKAVWGSALARGMGYVYVDDSGALHRESADESDQVISTDVTQASVAPNGLRVAYVLGAEGPGQIWGYDVGLGARYQLAEDSAPVSDVTWAPAANRIAYLRSDVGVTSLRVRNLSGSGGTTTIASGDIGAPAWFPDSIHIVFAVASTSPGNATHKAFVVNAAAPPTALNPALGMPSDPGLDLGSPVPSPDGHQIAFLSGDQIWLMNADGTRPTALTKTDPETFPYSCRTPAWSSA